MMKKKHCQRKCQTSSPMKVNDNLKKWPEKLRRYAPTKGEEKEERERKITATATATATAKATATATATATAAAIQQ